MAWSRILSRTKGEAVGGVTAAMAVLPWSMAIGGLIFSQLGSSYIPLGITAGLIGLGIGNLTVAPLGSLPILTLAPFSLSSFMLMGVLEKTVRELGGSAQAPGVAGVAIAMLFLTVFMSGLVQAFFGVCRLGNLAKYIPHPVLAGLMNGTAILILLSQLHPILGFTNTGTLWHLIDNISQAKWLTLIVVASVCLAIAAGTKLTRRVPASLLGIFAGTAVYYGLQWFGVTELGPVVGEIPAAIPSPHYVVDVAEAFSRVSPSLLGKLLLVSMGIAGVDSLSTLLVCTNGENLLQERCDGNQELIGQGLSNMACAIFGGIGNAGSLSGIQANYRYGGRSGYSRAITGAFALLVLLILHGLVADIPKAVLAGMLIMIALQAFDPWSIHLLPQLLDGIKKHNWAPFVSAFLVLLVTGVLLAFGILHALAAGITLSIFLFLRRMSRPIIQRELTGDMVHSNTLRPAEEFSLLETEGRRIHLLQLKGAIFFGTADMVAERTEELIRMQVEYVILDMQRVLEVDATGAEIIHQLLRKCQQRVVHLYLIWPLTEDSTIALNELIQLFSDEELSSVHCPGVEQALAKSEEQLLDNLIGQERSGVVRELSEQYALSGLDANELESIRSSFRKCVYEDRELVFRQGDVGDAVYFIISGQAEILQNIEIDNRTSTQVLATICAGACFGEMAIIGSDCRSTNVCAKGNLICYQLHQQDLDLILRQHPTIAYKILNGFTRELATRVRVSNRLKSYLVQ